MDGAYAHNDSLGKREGKWKHDPRRTGGAERTGGEMVLCVEEWHEVKKQRSEEGRDLGHGKDSEVVIQLAALLVTRSHHVR